MKKLLLICFAVSAFIVGCSSSPASSEPDFLSGEWKTTLDPHAMASLKQKASIPLGAIKIRLDTSKMTATVEEYGDKETYFFDFAVVAKKDYPRAAGMFGPGEMYSQDTDECGFLYVFSKDKDAANIESAFLGGKMGDGMKGFAVFFDFGTFRSQPIFSQVMGDGGKIKIISKEKSSIRESYTFKTADEYFTAKEKRMAK